MFWVASRVGFDFEGGAVVAVLVRRVESVAKIKNLLKQNEMSKITGYKSRSVFFYKWISLEITIKPPWKLRKTTPRSYYTLLKILLLIDIFLDSKNRSIKEFSITETIVKPWLMNFHPSFRANSLDIQSQRKFNQTPKF